MQDQLRLGHLVGLPASSSGEDPTEVYGEPDGEPQEADLLIYMLLSEQRPEVLRSWHVQEECVVSTSRCPTPPPLGPKLPSHAIEHRQR
jgi:hypothetical protein